MHRRAHLFRVHTLHVLHEQARDTKLCTAMLAFKRLFIIMRREVTLKSVRECEALFAVATNVQQLVGVRCAHVHSELISMNKFCIALSTIMLL